MLCPGYHALLENMDLMNLITLLHGTCNLILKQAKKTTKQRYYGTYHGNLKHRHAKRARVIFLVIGVFVELFTVMIWLSFFGLRRTARKKLEIYNL